MDKWIGDVVGLMHLHKITQKDLASYLGVTNEYISMILNGKKLLKMRKNALQKQSRR